MAVRLCYCTGAQFGLSSPLRKHRPPPLRVLLRVAQAAQRDEVAVPVRQCRVAARSTAFDVCGV